MSKKTWRQQWAADETIQRVRPVEHSDYLPNPHRGTTTFQRFQGDPLYPDMNWNDKNGPTTFTPAPKKLKANLRYAPWTTLSYCRWPWAWIEPEKGKYNWAIIDGALAAAKAHGQTLQARVQPYTWYIKCEELSSGCRKIINEQSVDVPEWYWLTGAKSYSDGTGLHPDHNDPLWVKHFGDFIRAFGKRYDGHPDLESVDMAYGGFWGEGGGNANPVTAARLVDTFVKSFRSTQLVSLLGTHGCIYAAGMGKPIGWRADCFGDMRSSGKGRVPDGLTWNHMYDAYPMEIFANGVQDDWRKAPVTYETCWTVAWWGHENWDVDWIIEQGFKYHVSVFMPKSVYYPENLMDKMARFDNYIGYRLVLRQMLLPLEAKPGQKAAVRMWMDNVGCAPIYRPYKLAWRFRQGKNAYLVRSAQDIRTWMPGYSWWEENIVVPKQLKPGEIAVDLGIVDDQDNLRVRLAINPADPDGWHPLTRMIIQ